MIARIGIWVLKACAVWVALVAGWIFGGLLSSGGAVPASLQDGPFTSEAALLIVTATHAALLAGLAAQARVQGLRLALFLFAILFGVQTFMMQIEAVYFNESLGVPWDALAWGTATAAVGAAFAAAAAALVFRPVRVVEAPAYPGLAWRIPAVAAAYVCFYFAAGLIFIHGPGSDDTWRSEALGAYYANAELSLAPLIVLQVVRGALWALLALLVVRSLKGPLAARATMTALAFSVFGAPQLLFPNAYMPWAVRLPHLIEIGISNALFGALAAVLLASRARRTQQSIGSLERVAATNA